jgi:hypothetical protein
MRHIKEYEEKEIRNLMGDLQGVGLGTRPDVTLTRDNFFEETMDYPQYADVSGPACEIAIDDLVSEFKERVNGIPPEDRTAALRAIHDLWQRKIEDLFGKLK